MKTAFKIAITELRILFYSPIAWFLMVIFLIQCGISYFTALEYPTSLQDMGGDQLQMLPPLTYFIFASPQSGMFSSVMEKLYLFVPLLTMGLISRETNNGTMKLLYSSPIRVGEIVAGKFIAMMVYCLLLTGILSILTIAGMSHIQHADGGMLIAATLGIYLLLLAYSAIGLFMSCLTTYQIVAAICTFVMIGILTYIGSLWQDIDMVKNITYYLSLRGRTEKMLQGLITSKDVLYFLLIVFIFLGLSIFKLRAGMESKPPLVKAGRYAAVVVSALLLGYISSLPALTWYIDCTDNKMNTVSANTQKIVEELKGAPLEITTYNNVLGKYGYYGLPHQRNEDLARWDKYIRFKNDLSMQYVQYYDSALDLGADEERQWYGQELLSEKADKWIKATRTDKKIVKTPAEIRQQIDLRPELNRYVMQLKWKDRTTYLRIFDDMRVFPGETETAAAFKRLLDAKLPKIVFVTGNLERGIHKSGDKEYKVMTNRSTFRYSLINQGFDSDTLSLDAREIPSDITALVLADPKIALSDTALAKLQRYINEGGNLVVLAEPGRQDILNPVLHQLGIQIREGQIVQQSRDNLPNLAITEPVSYAAAMFKPLARSMKDSLKVSMPGAAALTWSDSGTFIVEPLLLTDGKMSWNKKKKIDLDMITNADAAAFPPQQPGNTAPPAQAPPPSTPASGTLTFSEADGDTRGSFPTMVRMTRKINNREQRIIISGDADFMSNAELGRNNVQTANFVFSMSLFSWLSYGAYPIDANGEENKDKGVNVTVESISRLKTIYIWVLPAILAVFAAVLLIRRKRK